MEWGGAGGSDRRAGAAGSAGRVRAGGGTETLVGALRVAALEGILVLHVLGRSLAVATAEVLAIRHGAGARGMVAGLDVHSLDPAGQNQDDDDQQDHAPETVVHRSLPPSLWSKRRTGSCETSGSGKIVGKIGEDRRMAARSASVLLFH